MNNVVNQTPYIITSRNFPEDIKPLCIELSRTYIDIANAVNNRIISIFPQTRPAITGENWFINNQRQQTIRQVYAFTSTASIPHGITLSNISRFTSCYGMWTDGTNWYGLICGSNVAIPGQTSFYIDPTNIVFVVDVASPILTSGIIVLQWMSDV